MRQPVNPAQTEKKISRVVIATGISSVVSQLVLVREFLAQFQGNEFTIALILSSWLLLGGIGTWLARPATRRHPADISKLALFSLFLVALAALQIVAIRFLRDIIFLHGAAVGFYPTLAFIVCFSAPYALFDGFVLPYSLFTLRRKRADYPGARLYMLDNIGDVSGGALFTFVLVVFVTPLQAVFWANIPLLLASFFLLPKKEQRRPVFMLAVAGAFCALFSGLILEKKSLTPFEGTLVHYQESRYGRITVHQHMEQFTLFVDGAPVFGSQNRSLAEESIHFPLSQVGLLDSILVIGAEGGMFAEIAKYQASQVDYVEIEEKIAKVQFDFGLLEAIPGLRLIHRDGRAFLAGSKKKYDAVIINMPEPDTFQVNRFYTGDFFDLVNQHLTDGGIFSFTVAGFDNYLAEPQRMKISSLYNTAKEVFPHVLLLPGEKVSFLCSNQPLDTDIPTLLEKKQIQTTYIKSFFRGNITPDRLAYLQSNVADSAPVNQDTSPYILRIMFEQWFARFASSPLPFVIICAVLLIFYLVRSRREELVLFSTGFVTMGSEILVIFVYQILFGYVYEQIGLLVTVFLAGLLPGAWLGERLRHKKEVRKHLLFADTGLIVLLAFFLFFMATSHENVPALFFLVFGFFVSLLCGCQFPLALSLGGDDNPAATRTFSADLIGAACGTLITSLFFIPFFGIIWATAGLVLLKTIGMFSLLGAGVDRG